MDENQIVDDLVSSEGLTATRSTFDPRDVLRGVCEALPGGAHVDLTAARSQPRRRTPPETVALLRNQAPGERSYSTADLLAADQRSLALVADGRQQASRSSPTLPSMRCWLRSRSAKSSASS